MKNLFFLTLIFPLFILIGCGTGNKVSKSENNRFPISRTSVSNNLQYLSSDALEGRETGTLGIERAALHIEEVFQKNGIKPYFSTYRDSFEVKGKVAYNVIGYKEGIDPVLKKEFIIIGAHYDHVGKKESGEGDVIFNGANDNATGTTAVLELAKYFADKELKRSVLFTLFSAEELGLVGAKHLAQKLSAENLNLYVMFNLEMVGIPMAKKEYLAYITGYHRSNLAGKFNQYTKSEVLGYLPQAESYNLFQRSDNFPFYEVFQVPAHTVSTFDFSNFAFYHKPGDEFELMNIDHMVRLLRELVPGLEEMANSAEKEVKLKD